MLRPILCAKRSLKESIQWLHQNNFIDYQLTGYTYTIRIIPKGQSIAIPREWLHSIQAHHSSSEAVGWENVVKLLLWYLKCKPDQTVTNAIISNELGVSESTIISSKNVLRNELNAIETKNVSIKIDDGHFCSVGHIATVFAWWNDD